MKFFRLLIFVWTSSFSVLLGVSDKNSPPNFLKINSVEDYHRILVIRDKIELLELIEDRLIPLTDNDILDSKENDLQLYYSGIKETLKSYEGLRLSLEKYSHLKDQDIRDLYLGAINFLNMQRKILSLVAEAIEKKPDAKSLNDLPLLKMGSFEFLAFKNKGFTEAKKFRKTIEKVWNEIFSYSDALGIEIEEK